MRYRTRLRWVDAAQWRRGDAESTAAVMALLVRQGARWSAEGPDWAHADITLDPGGRVDDGAWVVADGDRVEVVEDAEFRRIYQHGPSIRAAPQGHPPEPRPVPAALSEAIGAAYRDFGPASGTAKEST